MSLKETQNEKHLDIPEGGALPHLAIARWREHRAAHGRLAAVLIGISALTGIGAIMLALAIDYGLRTTSRWQHSPLSWLALRLVRLLRLPDRPIDRAPKLFAARVGMLFALTSAILALLHPPSGLVVGCLLFSFALLEALLNICVGCLVYQYVMLPLFTQREDA